MGTQRDTIRKLGEQLSDMVISGSKDSAKAVEIAQRLNKLCREGGAYEKRYSDPEERVLFRHLNLYKNKRDKAQTTVERARWQGKIVEQEAKIAEWRKGGLDLDGL